MDSILLVSPHLDDAVLGAGEFIASWPGAHVATVCTAEPDPPQRTTYDANSGFTDSTHAMHTRRGEDRAALRALGAHHHHLGLLDAQYRGNAPEPEQAIADALMELVQLLDPTRLYTVLAVSDHPDHVATHNAVRWVADQHGLPLWCWEELPHRVLDPEAAVDRARALGGTLEFVGGDQRAVKQRAVTKYASQRWALNLACCWAPERFWRMP